MPRTNVYRIPGPAAVPLRRKPSAAAFAGAVAWHLRPRRSADEPEPEPEIQRRRPWIEGRGPAWHIRARRLADPEPETEDLSRRRPPLAAWSGTAQWHVFRRPALPAVESGPDWVGRPRTPSALWPQISTQASSLFITDADLARLLFILTANSAAYETDPDAAWLPLLAAASPADYGTDPDRARKLTVTVPALSAYETDPNAARLI